ncbi:hypothetical protein [Streptomyces sp. NBC_01465]|uniref:hypothetical protein n=1 Tax=Streptomyces sp. NBC_01465 TaxID=2903878 RepID=UPI002E32C8DB|nr:hypothetical protein [Streptomyces sp. NBC_01465]
MSAPTTKQLDAYIRTRLALAGVDLDKLPEVSDPATGAPTRAEALRSLRSFVASTPAALAGWGAEARPEYAQQASPPLIYPSITEAWTADATGGAR